MLFRSVRSFATLKLLVAAPIDAPPLTFSLAIPVRGRLTYPSSSHSLLLTCVFLLLKSLTTHRTQTQAVPSTPMSSRADPFSTLAPPSSTSVSASLRLPPMQEGVVASAFPQFPDSTSVPTLSPPPGVHPRPHYHSMPPAPAVSLSSLHFASPSGLHHIVMAVPLSARIIRWCWVARSPPEICFSVAGEVTWMDNQLEVDLSAGTS